MDEQGKPGMTLEQVIADARGEAAVLRANGHEPQAVSMERLAHLVASAAEGYLTWLSESDAIRRSNRTKEWLRSRFPEWEREGNARRTAKGREYRKMVIPSRANVTAAFEAGRKMGKAS